MRRVRVVSIAVAFAFTFTFAGSRALAQDPAATEVVRSYTGVGRIAWMLPATFAHYFAVPHFTTGPRLKCKDEDREQCEIQVLSRDLRTPAAERRQRLAADMKPFVGHSVEGEVRARTLDGDPNVVYATLTAPGANADFRLLTVGYAIKGPAIIRFIHRARDEAQVTRLLEIVRRARAVDTLAVWAWRLNDYRLVCAQMFPEHRAANDAAWSSSVFAPVDVAKFFETAWGMKADDVTSQLQRAREGFNREFYGDPPADQKALCERLPDWIAEAAKGVPAD